nr:hypothetical protein [Tanacetum cinerariifolium]
MTRFSSNDMIHNHYLEEAKKMTQERSRNSEPSLIPSARLQSTANGSKPMPRRNTQTSRIWPATKNSFVTTKKVNLRAKVPSNKTPKRNKPIEQKGVPHKQERQLLTGHRFSIQKTSVVQKKTMTPRSCLRWKPTCKIFKTVGLRWVPTGRILTSNTTKVDSEPLNSPNADITNQYECEQTLDISASTLNQSAEYRDEIKIDELMGNFNSMSIEINKKEKLQQLEQVANLSTYPSKHFNSFCYDDDDDEDYTAIITLDFLITDSLLMKNEHLDTIPKTESDEFIKSSVENLVPILSESEDFSNIESECDIPDCDDSQTINFSTFSNPLFDDSTSTDDESSHEESYLLESLLNRDTLMASSPKFDSLLEEFSSELTHTNLIPPGINKAFYDDHVKEISSGSTTTHSDSSLYDSFIFDLSINPFTPADMSDFYEFADELTHIISLPEYDCFFFKIEPNSGDFTMDVVEDISPTKEPRVHVALPTHPTLQLNLEFILSSESFFTYVVWIFLPFLSYLVAPQYLLSLGNEDTIFDPGICNYHFFLLGRMYLIGVELSQDSKY